MLCVCGCVHACILVLCTLVLCICVTSREEFVHQEFIIYRVSNSQYTPYKITALLAEIL